LPFGLFLSKVVVQLNSFGDFEMARLYTFNNMYLSPIQHGIQTAHVVSELFVKYDRDETTEEQSMLFDWAENHKTLIVMNGGYAQNLRTVYAELENTFNPYPYAKFHEEEAALDGALTSVGIVVPARVYNLAKFCKQQKLLPAHIKNMSDKLIHELETSIMLLPSTDSLYEFDLGLALRAMNDFDPILIDILNRHQLS